MKKQVILEALGLLTLLYGSMYSVCLTVTWLAQ